MQTRTVTRRPDAKSALLPALVLALFLASLAAIPEIAAATSTSSSSGTAPALDSVAVTIQPTGGASVSSFDLVAYNASGSPVASYTGQYPRVTFELPGGSYLLVATANGQSTSPTPVCCGCAVTTSSGGVSSPPAQTSISSASTAIPCCCAYPPGEYGYALVQVSGPTSVNIQTLTPSSIPTSDVSVAVSYENGTAVSGAYVSTTAVGENFYWNSNSTTMSAQTGHDGVAHLVVPQIPLTVSASKSVQINLPKEQSTIQVNVGGQLVNVTVFYSPSFVYLSASGLLIPPQASLSLVLAVQSSQVYPPGPIYATTATATPGVVAGSASSAGSTAPQTQSSSATTSGSTGTQPATIPPIPSSLLASMSSSTTSPGAQGSTLTEVGILAVAAGAAALAAAAISKRRG